MKLIIQIPCFNEEKTLPLVINDLPKKISGISKIEYLIIDDGSTDKTVEVAHKIGVHHIVQLPYNQGLAKAFRAGIDACLSLGADIVVNTDGDNQYNGADIEKLVKPILERKAGIVIGERPIMETEHFSVAKKILQRMGSWLVRVLSKTNVADAPSGFRAWGREALLKLNLVTDYTYTIESIIQAGRKGIPIVNVPISTNEKTRESRLMRSIPSYIRISLATMVRVWLTYTALKFFVSLSVLFILSGVGIGVRFLVYYFQGLGSGKIQSLILMVVLLFVGFQILVLGLLADLIGNNKKDINGVYYEIRKIRYESPMNTQTQSKVRKTRGKRKKTS